MNNHAIEFLKHLDHSLDATFNIEHYTDLPKGQPKPKPDPLKGRYANLSLAEVEQLLPGLTKINEQGAGIFVARNQCDGHRNEQNVSRVRGVHADMDDVTLYAFRCEPSRLNLKHLNRQSNHRRGRYSFNQHSNRRRWSYRRSRESDHQCSRRNCINCDQ